MKIHIIRQQITGILPHLLILCLLSCSQDSSTVYEQTYEYSIPAQTDDEWQTAPLSAVGIDEQPICQFMNELINNIDHEIHSIVIIKDNKLVFTPAQAVSKAEQPVEA